MLTPKIISFGLVLSAMTGLAATSFASVPPRATAVGGAMQAKNVTQPFASPIMDPTLFVYYELKAVGGTKEDTKKGGGARLVPETALDK